MRRFREVREVERRFEDSPLADLPSQSLLRNQQERTEQEVIDAKAFIDSLFADDYGPASSDQ